MNTGESLVQTVLERPLDDAPRFIYADWLEEHGQIELAVSLRIPSLILKTSFAIFGGGYDGGDGGDDDDGGDGDGGYGDDDGGGGGGSGYGGYGGYGDGDLKTLKRDDIDMKNGLKIITIPSGYNPYVLIAWCTVDGLEIIIKNARIIKNFGAGQSLAQLAKKGPASDTKLLEASEEEEIWRPDIGRAIKADVKSWAKHCPKPDDWE